MANLYTIKQSFKYVPDDWWEWSVWIDAKDVDLDKIEKVVYTLHATFRNPVRTINDRSSKFRLDSEGWGIFTIYAKVFLSEGKPISLEHDLYLEYPDGTANTD
jgi:transcription initiation factor IIF auxiliary subunit